MYKNLLFPLFLGWSEMRAFDQRSGHMFHSKRLSRVMWNFIPDIPRYTPFPSWPQSTHAESAIRWITMIFGTSTTSSSQLIGWPNWRNTAQNFLPGFLVFIQRSYHISSSTRLMSMTQIAHIVGLYILSSHVAKFFLHDMMIIGVHLLYPMKYEARWISVSLAQPEVSYIYKNVKVSHTGKE